MTKTNSLRQGPDERGHFGIYGGRYVAETLMPVVLEVETAYREAKKEESFNVERMYATINNKELMLIQNYVFNKVLITIDELKK